jgi:hypothetical protein
VTAEPIERANRRRSDAIGVVREIGASAMRHASAAIAATLTGARYASRTVQTAPDSTLRWLTATSVGLGTGLFLARAPRVVVAAGIAPALLVAAAIAARPDPVRTEVLAG